MGTYTGSDKRLKYLFENGGGGGGSANIWTGTMAEYLAQASQIADDTAVFITDDEIQSLIVSSYDVYSTEEKEVGVWTDGKPLYQKTIKASLNVSSQSSETITQLTDIDHLMVKEGTFLESGIIYTMNEMSNRISFNKSTGNLIFTSATGSSWNGEIQITIQYTKTTDVAGSGIFVPSGSAAVHYSTTEQVIGTWINGKPLYRKTFSVNNSVTLGTQYNLSHDLTNIDEIVDIDGTYYNDADARQYPLPNMRVMISESVWIASFVPSNHTPIIAIQSGGYSYGNISKIRITIEYTKTTD